MNEKQIRKFAAIQAQINHLRGIIVKYEKAIEYGSTDIENSTIDNLQHYFHMLSRIRRREIQDHLIKLYNEELEEAKKQLEEMTPLSIAIELDNADK